MDRCAPVMVPFSRVAAPATAATATAAAATVFTARGHSPPPTRPRPPPPRPETITTRTETLNKGRWAGASAVVAVEGCNRQGRCRLWPWKAAARDRPASPHPPRPAHWPRARGPNGAKAA